MSDGEDAAQPGRGLPAVGAHAMVAAIAAGRGQPAAMKSTGAILSDPNEVERITLEVFTDYV